jgi:heptosyltransferase-1
VFDINGLLRSALLARLTRARLRVGFSEDSDICKERHAAWLLDRTHAVPHVHVVEQTVQLIEKTLMVALPRPLVPYLPPNFGAAQKAEALLRDNGLAPGTFAVIAAGGGWETKLLDEPSLVSICDFLGDYHITPVLSWSGEAERKRALSISRLSSVDVTQLGNCPIDIFLEVLRMARIVVGPDTGAVHAASAVQTPTVSYYGPSSAGYSGPRRSTDRVVQLSPECGPCFRRRCSENLCNHLSIGPILDEIGGQLERTREIRA